MIGVRKPLLDFRQHSGDAVEIDVIEINGRHVVRFGGAPRFVDESQPALPVNVQMPSANFDQVITALKQIKKKQKSDFSRPTRFSTLFFVSSG